MKIEILRGMSYSGKTTYAEEKAEESWIIVSRDKIRETYCWACNKSINDYFAQGLDKVTEDAITSIEHKELARAICKGKNIVIDNTNLKRKYVQEYINIFNDLGVETTDVSLVDFPITLEEAKERIKERPDKIVNEEILEKQFEQFKSCDWDLSSFKKRSAKDKDIWIATRDKKKWYFTDFDIHSYYSQKDSVPAIIVDIDGTLAHRSLQNGKFRSFYDYEAAMTDNVDESIKWLLENIQEKCQIIVVSGRMDSSFITLAAWLEKNLAVNNFLIYMRKNDDKRSDDIVKYEIFDECIRNKYDVKFVIDDRDRVCAMWQELGLKVFNVGDLNEHF